MASSSENLPATSAPATEPSSIAAPSVVPTSSVAPTVTPTAAESPDKPDHVLGLKTEGQMKIQQNTANNEDSTVIDISDAATQQKIRGYISGLKLSNVIKINPVMGANTYYINVVENGQENVYCFTATKLDDGSCMTINYQNADPMAKYGAASDSYEYISALFA